MDTIWIILLSLNSFAFGFLCNWIDKMETEKRKEEAGGIMRTIKIKGCHNCPFAISRPVWYVDSVDFFIKECRLYSWMEDKDIINSEFKVSYEDENYVWEKCPLKDGCVFVLKTGENVKVLETYGEM